MNNSNNNNKKKNYSRKCHFKRGKGLLKKRLQCEITATHTVVGDVIPLYCSGCYCWVFHQLESLPYRTRDIMHFGVYTMCIHNQFSSFFSFLLFLFCFFFLVNVFESTLKRKTMNFIELNRFEAHLMTINHS